MKNSWTKWCVLPVAAFMAGTVAMAQEPAQQQDPTIQQRKENQRDRIGNGVKEGQLSSGETSRLEGKEAAINAETKADRAANGGKLIYS